MIHIETLIKIGLGVLVVVVVILGIYFSWDYIIDFFKNIGGGEAAEIFLGILK